MKIKAIWKDGKRIPVQKWKIWSKQEYVAAEIGVVSSVLAGLYLKSYLFPVLMLATYLGCLLMKKLCLKHAPHNAKLPLRVYMAVGWLGAFVGAFGALFS